MVSVYQIASGLESDTACIGTVESESVRKSLGMSFLVDLVVINQGDKSKSICYPLIPIMDCNTFKFIRFHRLKFMRKISEISVTRRLHRR